MFYVQDGQYIIPTTTQTLLLNSGSETQQYLVHEGDDMIIDEASMESVQPQLVQVIDGVCYEVDQNINQSYELDEVGEDWIAAKTEDLELPTDTTIGNKKFILYY